MLSLGNFTWSGLVNFLLISSFSFCLAAVTVKGSPIVTRTELKGVQVKPEQECINLEPKKVIERRLAKQEKHCYQIALMPDQFFQAVFEQKGTNLLIKISGPNGEKIAEGYDSPVRESGSESIFIVAQTKGIYRLEVQSYGTKASGEYAVRMGQIRQANLEDKNRFAAIIALSKGNYILRGIRPLTDTELNKAIELFKEALNKLYILNTKDTLLEGRVLFQLGRAYSKSNKYDQAVEEFEKVLTLPKSTKEQEIEILTLIELGHIYNDMGSYEKANNHLQRALKLSGKQPNRRRYVCFAERELGHASFYMEEMEAAKEHYKESLTIAKEDGDKINQASAQLSLGIALGRLGNIKESLEQLYEALGIAESVDKEKDEGGEDRDEILAMINGGIGSVYSDLNDQKNALGFYEKALKANKDANNKRYAAEIQNNIAIIYRQQKEYKRAEEYYKEALQNCRDIGEKLGETSILANLAKIYLLTGRAKDALTEYKSVLKAFQVMGNKQGEAVTFENIGKIYLDLDAVDTLEKEKYFDKGLDAYKSIKDKRGEASSSYFLALQKYKRKQFSESREYIETAIKVIEEFRKEIPSGDLRTLYFASVQDYYRFYIKLLMEIHEQSKEKGDERYGKEALDISEKKRARSLLEFLYITNTDIRKGVPAKLIERETDLQRKIADVKGQLIDKNSNNNVAQEEINKINGKLSELEQQYRQLEVDISSQSPPYSNPVPLTAEQIKTQVVKDDDTLLLEYTVGQDNVYLWTVTSKGVKAYTINVPKKQIEDKAEQLLGYLTSKKVSSPTDVQKVAASLGVDLLGQIASELNKRKIIVIADGILAQLPFALLPIPGEPSVPLLTHHQIITLPSASILNIVRTKSETDEPTPNMISLFVDPVFSREDGRLLKLGNHGNQTVSSQKKNDGQRTEDGDTLGSKGCEIPTDNLPGTKQLADEVKKFLEENKMAEPKIFPDFDANRINATSTELRKYRIIHFGTHGFFCQEKPELSGILLSRFKEDGEEENGKGIITYSDIFNLNLPTKLVVLQACYSGQGERIEGEGIKGLAYGFMYAGTKQVIASLWKVDNGATLELMKEFYRGIIQRKLSPEKALQEAQLLVQQNKENDWAHPRFWAAWIIQGVSD